MLTHSEESELKMKNFKEKELIKYLEKIKTETLLAYGVYQVEAAQRIADPGRRNAARPI